VNTGVVYYSPRWREMIGLAPAEAPDTLEAWFSHIVPADRLAITELVAAYLQGPEDLLQCSYRMLHADGTPRWMSCRGIASRALDGAVVRVAGSQSDVTEEKTCDRLTGLPNRLRLISQVECILDSPAHAKAGGNDAYAVLFLYLDGFKTISDSLGHAAGDHLLKAIASRLTLAAGASFLADPGNRTPLVVRMSGDEFAILLEGTANKAAVRLFATEEKQLMKEPFDMAGHSVHCTFSIGIALASPSHHVAEEVLREAGMAIYVAKFQRSGDLAVYDSSMRDAAMQRLELENDIRSAVGGCQLVLLYQPKVDLSTALTYGVEALVRWIHPQRGLLQPAVFIPIAEETGAIVEIGRWVFSEACLQVLRWHKQFPLGPPLELSVNLSPREFKQKDLVEEVRRTLQETGFPAASLHLEITENLLFEDMEAARATLYALKGLGVRLDLDDFGSGYSSLKYLRELPFDTLKIDSYFTVGLDPNEPASGKLIQAILNMGKNLGLQVVAEGIETEMHSTALRRLGCRFGQGFYYSRPLPREDMQARLAIERNTGVASLLSAPATVSPAHRRS